MLKKDNHIYQSTLLLSYGIDHGYSTRWFGDMRLESSRVKYLDGKMDRLVLGEQVHGNRIHVVSKKDAGSTLSSFDGLVSTKGVLGVTFADCVPILAADTKKGIVGTAHAGWKGTLAHIAKELIKIMREMGANSEDIVVSVGPHIGMCCYNVEKDRAQKFMKEFGNDKKIVSRVGDIWYLDIGYANLKDLLEVGIKRDHIDAPPTCTSCQVSEFNSFRKDKKDTFGVQLGVISV